MTRVVLLSHLMNWEHQPDKHSNSWRGTILAQRRELNQLLESGTLRRHAEEVLPRAYAEAVEQAATETGLDKKVFPAKCLLSLEQVLSRDGLS
jgi:hypothetical protein